MAIQDTAFDVKAYRKAHYRDNMDAYKSKARAWRLANPEKTAYARKRYRIKHKDSLYSKYLNKKRNNPIFRMICNFRNRLWMVARDRCFSSTTQQLVGCSREELRHHIESQFVDGMSWDNYGTVWHIDHIVPIAAFNMMDESQARKCFHFSNLQPLFAMDNFKKNALIQ